MVVAKSDRLLSLRVTETFTSIQGEALSVGALTHFIRLTGCPLRCQYCDTAYAFTGGQHRNIDALVQGARDAGVRHVCVTGGEPLAQPACIDLLRQLCDQGFAVSLETSGAMDISKVDSRVARVVDIKTPDSLEVNRNRWENLAILTQRDQLKFVICSRRDFDWAVLQLAERDLPDNVVVYFSPSYEQVSSRELADWMLEARPVARLQMQLHKFLWGDERGR